MPHDQFKVNAVVEQEGARGIGRVVHTAIIIKSDSACKRSQGEEAYDRCCTAFGQGVKAFPLVDSEKPVAAKHMADAPLP